MGGYVEPGFAASQDGIGQLSPHGLPENDLLLRAANFQVFGEARGEYLTILDDDDLLFPRHISMIEKGVEKYGVGPMFQSFAVQRQLDVRQETERWGRKFVGLRVAGSTLTLPRDVVARFERA